MMGDFKPRMLKATVTFDGVSFCDRLEKLKKELFDTTGKGTEVDCDMLINDIERLIRDCITIRNPLEKEIR